MPAAHSNRVDAVVPLTLSDLARFGLLLDSLAPRFEAGRCLFVVVPERQLREVRSALEDKHGAGLILPASAPPTAGGRGDGAWVHLIGEEAVVPELARHARLKGWYKQQLVKLAIADWVATPFYLTLDADVVCTRTLRYADLVHGERGLCRVHGEDLHPDWYRQSARVLGLSPARTGISHNVTPALLARDGVRALATFLQRRARSEGPLARLRARFMRAGGPPPNNWRDYLARHVPWTEYALYYTFLEATGQFERYHFEAPTGLYEKDDSVWRKDAADFARWDPAPRFAGTGLPAFVVIQSISGLSPDRIRAKLGAFL